MLGAFIASLNDFNAEGGHTPANVSRSLSDSLRCLLRLLSRFLLVSHLLEIPTVVASTDLLGPVLSSMVPLLEKQLGLQALASPLKLATTPIYMIWHETRRHDAAHRWLRDIVGRELSSFAPG